MDPGMQQAVEVVLCIDPAVPATPDEILDLIALHVRTKRSVALDRVAF